MDEKKNLREYAQKIARGFSEDERKASDTEIFRNLASLRGLSSAQTVFCFIGVGEEPNTEPLIRALLRTGRRVAVPRCGENGSMDAVEIKSLDELKPGRFGIPEPDASLPALDKSEIGAAVIPGVAFDGDGGRLGRGGGYYDRWLSGFDGFKCGVCRDRLLSKSDLPRGEHDIAMDVVVTDKRVVYAASGEAEQTPSDSENKEATTRITRAELAQSRSLPRGAQESSERVQQRRPVRRGRGAGYGCLRAAIWFLLVIGISAAFAGFGWLCADDLLSLTREPGEVTVTVTETDGVSDVAEKLKDGGLIKYPWLFKLFGSFAKADEKIEAGTYTLNKVMDYRALVSAMRQRSAYRATVDVTIPEGFTLDQVLRRLADNGVSTYEELTDACANHDFEYSFLDALPYGETNRLEGYLFPDTYTFYVGESPISALDKMLSNFSGKFTSAYRERAEELGYSMKDILAIASLIEKEAANTDEMSTISSVIHNRLESQYYPKLQIDATIQYILTERKAVLTFDDLAIDNPYNTYLYEGLPPGPICCPGAASIKAALYPKSTNYYYYALTSEGVHEFARTAEEHQKIIDANPEVYGKR